MFFASVGDAGPPDPIERSRLAEVRHYVGCAARRLEVLAADLPPLLKALLIRGWFGCIGDQPSQRGRGGG